MTKDGTPVVVCVDDQDVDALTEVIRRTYGSPIDLYPARSLGEARGLIDGMSDTIDVLVVDIFLEQGRPTGIDFAREIKNRYPVIFVSGHDESTFRNEIEGLSPLAYHDKPVDAQKLCAQIRSGVELKSRAEALDQDATYVKNLSLSHANATILCASFSLGEVHRSEACNPAACKWDFAPLALGIRSLERCIDGRRGRVLHISGTRALAIFPGSGAASDHFAQALSALVQANNAIGGLLSKSFHPARFGAGVIPGTMVMGFFGDRNPGHSAVVGRLVDIAERIAYSSKAGEVGTVEGWMKAADRKTFDALKGPERREQVRVSGVLEPLDIVYRKY